MISKYTGQTTEGIRDGKGRLDFSNADYYEGDFKNGVRHGFGIMFEEKGKKCYEGHWSLSQRHGQGTQRFGNGDIYNGEFVCDKFEGKGELNTRGGVYKGEFKNGLKNGFGIMNFKTGARYEGMWRDGRFEGRGLYVWEDTLKKYEGNWFKGMRHGEGILILPNGEKYDGMFAENKKHGSGWWKFTHGKVRPGEWRDDSLLRWTGPEQFEAQMKAKKLKGKLKNKT